MGDDKYSMIHIHTNDFQFYTIFSALYNFIKSYWVLWCGHNLLLNLYQLNALQYASKHIELSIWIHKRKRDTLAQNMLVISTLRVILLSPFCWSIRRLCHLNGGDGGGVGGGTGDGVEMMVSICRAQADG